MEVERLEKSIIIHGNGKDYPVVGDEATVALPWMATPCFLGGSLQWPVLLTGVSFLLIFMVMGRPR